MHRLEACATFWTHAVRIATFPAALKGQPENIWWNAIAERVLSADKSRNPPRRPGAGGVAKGRGGLFNIHRIPASRLRNGSKHWKLSHL
jgi:hypothetical protein